MHKLLALALVAVLPGCVGAAVNQATLYRPVTGVIEMEVKIPSGESVEKVQFQVNDKIVGEDEDGTDGFSAEVDTSTLPVDTLAKLAAVGVRPNGSNVVLRENYILVERDDSSTDDTSTEPLPAANADGSSDATETPVTPTATDEAAAYKAAGPTPKPTASPKPKAASTKKKKVTVIKLGG